MTPNADEQVVDSHGEKPDPCWPNPGGTEHCWHRHITIQHCLENHRDDVCCWCGGTRCVSLSTNRMPGHGKYYR